MTLLTEGLEALVVQALAESSDYWAENGTLITEIAISLASLDPAVRAMAKADLEAMKKRFQEKFKGQFRTTEMKTRIDAEVARLKQEAAIFRAEESAKRGKKWEDGLVRKVSRDPDKQGGVAPCEHNAILYMMNHRDWKGSLGYDLFSDTHLVLRDLPIGVKAGETLQDHHDTLIQAWLQNETHEPGWKIDTVRRAANCTAKANSSHLIRDYLADVYAKWDGVERLPNWLAHYCGAGPAEGSDSPDDIGTAAFIAASGTRWMISAVARIIEPGCKVDHVLVLEGLKGIGKTSLVDILFAGHFAMISGDVLTKDNKMLISCNWGILMDELDVLNKSEMRAIKSWVTEQTTKFRPVFGVRVVDRPRQCVFIATVNGNDWAMEEDRRWWPIACKGMFDLEGLRRDRDQLLGEAVARYYRCERWHLDAVEDAGLIEVAKREQAARVAESVNDAMYVRVAHSIVHRSSIVDTVSIEEVFSAMIPSPNIGDRRRYQGEVGKALRAGGWTREPFKPQYGMITWRYKAPARAEDD